ncbi:hypothetical protein [Chryseobacterium gossypii]|uniref:hypothetical protein n=1 Tax=Chryseobacterium gossypii TaxID=3231602 RepID=UPI0035262703
MKNLKKKDELFNRFQTSKIERIKLEKINGGGWVTSPSQDIQTGMTSSGNHDNTQTAPDRWYNGGSSISDNN